MVMKLYWTGDVGWIDSEGNGITISSVKAALEAANGQPIEVELTTMGGNFFEAAPILNLLRNYKGQKTAFLNGIVASAGTVIAIGFDKIIARPTSMFMVHNAQSVAFGDHNEMREQADLQERMSDTIANEYAARTGKTLKQVKKWMDDETWFMGQEIVDAGFADEMEADIQQKATAMMLITAQHQFKERVTMWAKAKPEPVTMDASTKAAVEAMVASGSVDKVTAWTVGESDKVVGFKVDASKDGFKYPVAKNGKVFLSSLRSIAARAEKDDPELAEWATAMIVQVRAKGELRVNKEAVLAWLKDNPGCADEVAATMGLKLVTNVHTQAVEMKAKFDAEKIADPVAEMARLREESKTLEADKIKVAMSVFGPEKFDNGAKNKSREFAELALKGVPFAELTAKIEEVKKNETFLALRGELFDANSEVNLLGFSESKDVTLESGARGLDIKASALVL